MNNMTNGLPRQSSEFGNYVIDQSNKIRISAKIQDKLNKLKEELHAKEKDSVNNNN